VLLLARADYARGHQRRPVVVSAIAVAVNVVLDFALVIPFGATGVATATTIATIVNAALLARGLDLHGFELRRELVKPVLRVCAAGGVMLAGVLLFRFGIERLELPRWEKVLGMSLPLRNAVIVGGGIAIGLALFFGSARWVCRAELDELLRLLRQRRARRSEPPAAAPAGE